MTGQNESVIRRNDMRLNGTGPKAMDIMNRVVFPLILLLYPLRHINIGLDLWDTGYSYGNFVYMGTDHMDPMWLFSTYLANAVGWLLTHLPFGDTLLGMNFYTTFMAAALALMGYLFCTKKLGIPSRIAFLGDFAALNLCWCPTAVLYNYLTYILFLAGCICLYLGLKDDRNRMLVIAGICLGTNVMVRFSNLAEAGMIAAVWAYAIICRRSFKKTAAQTGWCMLGYFGALGVWLSFIAVRYGLPEYVEEIGRLFGMTDTATDYTPVSMVLGMFELYIENMYWFRRLCVIVAAGFVGFAVLPRKLVKLKKVGYTGIIALTVCWLYHNRFCDMEFHEYYSMLRPGVLFLMMAICIGIIEIFRPSAAREDKLLSGIVILIILITPLGSNNKLFPILNNLFLAGPYVFWMIWRFCRTAKGFSGKAGRVELLLHPFPVKAMAVMLSGIMLVQGIGFGATFVFVETHGARDVYEKVENNEVLKGIRMNSERAEWMKEISDYVNVQGLEGKEVVLYGNIPSLTYYLNMPSAFNSWSDLRSFSPEAMKDNMEQLAEEVESGEEPPVVILEMTYGAYLLAQNEQEGTNANGETAAVNEEVVLNEKFGMILDFLETYQYKVTFSNEKFVLLEAGR